MRPIYISATAQHAGKTTTSLGLYKLFEKNGHSVNYIKPVGQRSLSYRGCVVDEDAILFKENLKCQTPLEAMTAVTVPKGFTEKYIFNRNKAEIYDDIDKAVMRLNENTDTTIIEGTGHAGVGSVFDASNAAVACILGAKAVIISGGGIGKCLDKIALNQALFEKENVEVIGAVINKVLPEKYDKIKRVVGQGLKNMGLECLGVIPYQPELTSPTVEQLVHGCKFELISGNEKQNQNHVRKKLTATLSTETLKNKISQDTMLIVGENSQISMPEMNNKKNLISAVLFTDKRKPTDKETADFAKLNIPVMFTTEDTFSASAKIGSLIVKISPGDTFKFKHACQTMEKHLNIEKITELLNS